ncbi:hypothetical protein N7463_007281 [Penicillium fimorum]|uniref:Uncharacterized protein n=1 Tax=Penicillium fimorum TaxID=1882269 RepID=A0A9W9XVZ9_9EURO|nr:hypothetical protein N7463_007281 [Penicillium fimorum]
MCPWRSLHHVGLRAGLQRKGRPGPPKLTSVLILAAVNSRAIRAEKIQGKLDQELSTTRKALVQVTDELEQVSRLG